MVAFYLFSERWLHNLLHGLWFSLEELMVTGPVKMLFPFVLREGALCSQNPVI
jgi:hypothetical protein